MPEAMDCTFDHLIEDYTQIVLDRMDSKDLEQYVYDSLISYYEKMTEHELIEHINEMECSETADEIISTHYGLNPPDCYITGRDDQKIQPETSSQTVYSRIPSRY
tara:strand:- start:1081 stop:1395 length:315 start_codon:yes stop_codon:yes gene_type:complete